MTSLPDAGEVFRARYGKLTKEQIIELFTGRVTNPLDIAECERFWLEMMDNWGGPLYRANEDMVDKFCDYADKA